VDTRIIEILFGIPDYRYKVWLLRLVIVFALTFFILIILSFLSSITLTDVPVISMAAQVMFPVLFFGSIAFMISTILTNGNAAAVVMIIGGIGLWIAQPSIGSNKWNPFLNPYNIPQNVSDTVWADIALQNRIYLAAVILAVLLYALLNLQKREKFMR
jgi:ABC-type transport system involved in multi-copper enzyme maturation permease subunit